MYDAVDGVLSGEQGVLSDSVDEPYWRGGLSAPNSSSVTGRFSVSQTAVGVLSFSSVILALGRGFTVDRCKRMSLTEGVCLLQG